MDMHQNKVGGPKKTSIPSWLTPSKEQLSTMYSSLNRLQRARLDDAQERGVDSVYCREEAFSEENTSKHRIASIAPYDATRVRRLPGEMYINASEFEGPDWVQGRKQEWIAAQSPMKETASEFLAMLFTWGDDLNSDTRTTPRSIVSFKENEKGPFEECYDYIPRDGEVKQIVSDDKKIVEQLGEFHVRVLDEKRERNEENHSDCWIEREIEVVNEITSTTTVTGTPKITRKAIIHHFEYVGWLGRKIESQNENDLVRLWDAVQASNCKSDDTFVKTAEEDTTPIIVDCPTGIGRTGVLITIASLVENIRGEDREHIAEDIIKTKCANDDNSNENVQQRRLRKGGILLPVDILANPVFFVIEYLRDYRLGMVQSMDQTETVLRVLYREYARYVHPLYD